MSWMVGRMWASERAIGGGGGCSDSTVPQEDPIAN